MKKLFIFVLMSMFFVTCSIPEEPDVDPPVVALLYPTEGARLSGTIPVSIVAGDNDKVKRVEFYLDGELVREWTSRPYNFQWNIEPYADGETHAVSAAAYDDANNIGVTSIINVQLIKSSDFQADNIPPSINLVYPLGGETIIDSVRVSFLANDNRGVAKVELYRNGLLEETDFTAPYTFLINSSLFPEGNYTFYGIAYDSSGNSTLSNNVSVTKISGTEVDNLDPVVAIVYPVTGSGVDSIVHFVIDAQDNDAISSVSLYRNGALEGSDTDVPYEFFWDSRDFDYGSTHVFFVEARDQSGNIGYSTTINLTRDSVTTIPPENAAPVVTILNPIPDDTLSGTVEIRVDVIDQSPISKVEFLIDGDILFTDTTAPYTFELDTETYPNNSRHTLYIKAYDIYGNIGTAFQELLFE
ncbi:MAG: hypothetical protein Kow00108_14990 [Calditrichia bacterium]